MPVPSSRVLTVRVLRTRLAERRRAPTEPLFPTTTGTRLSLDAVEHRLTRDVALVRTTCPTLQTKRIGMHTVRRTAAMMLLESGTAVTVIALWLGHSSRPRQPRYTCTPT